MPDLAFTRLAGDENSAHLLVVGPSLGTGVAGLWQSTAQAIPDGWEVVGWDIPGHGASAPTTAAYSIDDLADSVRNRAAQLAAGRPAGYAGVSLGGAVGFTLALDPGPFAGIATIAAGPVFGTPDAWRERAAFVRDAGTSSMVEGSAGRWFAPGFLERDGATGNALLLALREVDDESYALACEALAQYDVRDRLGNVAVPLLVVAGEHDVVISPDIAREAAQAASHAGRDGARSAVLDGVAHLPPAEDPGATADLLVSFLGTEGDR
ncbi:alpha/beta fold hydrolase [Cumulibacter manganitolerans]|uniref:alpha/beta fold hydrolase n=1 Tax=Cumulibacter manganitolerans TaxID=1884992 RepID=UPI0012951BD9|nr:alpha/beta hydrolase [Cumulibacter manganitolerans]